MKLEVGMYVRTEYGIAKIVDIDRQTCSIYVDKCLQPIDDTRIAYEFIIGEPSFNLIELIEKDDYVNGLKVSIVGKTYLGRKDKAIYCDYCINPNTGKWIMIYDDEIKSIVTKEQFESMSYKV